MMLLLTRIEQLEKSMLLTRIPSSLALMLALSQLQLTLRPGSSGVHPRSGRLMVGTPWWAPKSHRGGL